MQPLFQPSEATWFKTPLSLTTQWGYMIQNLSANQPNKATWFKTCQPTTPTRLHDSKPLSANEPRDTTCFKAFLANSPDKQATWFKTHLCRPSSPKMLHDSKPLSANQTKDKLHDCKTLLTQPGQRQATWWLLKISLSEPDQTQHNVHDRF